MAELSSCDRGYVAGQTENSYYLVLYRKVADSRLTIAESQGQRNVGPEITVRKAKNIRNKRL